MSILDENVRAVITIKQPIATNIAEMTVWTGSPATSNLPYWNV
jgi:hypothetical protein